jgi:hypothetical protein
MSTTESSIIERISAHLAPEPKNEPAAQPTEAAAPDAEPAAAPNDDSGDAGESGGEVSALTERGGETDAVADSDEIEIGDLNGLAEYLNVDPADLYNIAIPFTKNGQKDEFTLGDLKDKYQRFEETEALRADAQAQRDAYEAGVQQAQQAAQDYALQASAIAQAMEQSLLADFGQINWQALQQQNPAEYIRAQQALAQRQDQLQKMKQGAWENIEKQKSLFQEQENHFKQQRLLREQQALLKAVPEWRDQKVADAERHELARYMVERGYSEEEINAVDDHRAILLVRDAMKYRAMQSKGEIAAKKVIKLAKNIVKPGTRQTASEQTNDQERGLRKNLKQTGSVQDAAALLSRRLKLGR